MSAKTISTIFEVALVAAAIAVNFIPGVGQVLSAAMITAITGAGVAAGLTLTESVLLGPGTPNVGSSLNNQVSRLYATLVTTEPRKAVPGHTAFATDIRYDTYTGAKQEHYHQIVGCACHKVTSIDQIWLDNELAWASAGGVQGRYVGYLTVQAVLEGTRANGIAIDATWTANSTLTGCAYVHLDYLLVGPDASTPSPFQTSVTNRMTIIGKGAPMYDPRKDSTVAGGSGAHRANDQTTWEWDDNACNNPALQELFYELGWRINGVLSVGKGVPPARLQLSDYITAANLCDELVPLKAGGTEPRYRGGGVISEGDDPKSVRDTICQAMNAEMRDNGSGISLQVLHDDLADVLVDFGADDILQEGDFDESGGSSLDQYFNIVRGRCVDPGTQALYQLTDYPEQSVASPDGLDRPSPFDLPWVSSGTQAQRLAKLHLMRKQFQGTYNPVLSARAWRMDVGRNITFTHPVLPWVDKIMRTAGKGVSRKGPTKSVLIEEDPSIYAWNPATDEKSLITAGLPTVYDPNNNPLVAPSTGDVAELINTSSIIDPDPSTPVLTASESQIYVKSHQRRYSDKTVPVIGNTDGAIDSEAGTPLLAESGAALLTESGSAPTSLSGLVAGTHYFVGYSDPTRAGGAVVFIASTNPYDVTNSGAGGASPFMHYVGEVTTAGAGSGSTSSGTVASPPGFHTALP